MPKPINELEKKMGIVFDDKSLLIQALVHRSYLNEHPEFKIGQNERLEFLGDAVLELAVTRYLFLNYLNPEGELTNWRASLVNGKMLADLAKKFDLSKYIYLSKGEQKDTGKARMYILANAIEAVIGAIYLDKGFEVTKDFIEKHLLIKLPMIIEKELYLDPKSKFQEISQDKLGITPSYKVLEEQGPDHAKIFTVGVLLGDEMVAQAVGSSKQEAQIKAAQEALKIKNWF
jgi:ribonuclease-3